VGLRVGALEVDVAQAGGCGPAASLFDQLRRQVDPEHVTLDRHHGGVP
jgi:hypothetical protein